MKRYIKNLFTYVLIVSIFTSCTYPLDNNKSNNYYYTNLVAKHIKLNNKLDIKVMDTNFYKELDLSKDNISTIKNFINNLKGTNFINKPADLPKKPEYKLYLKFTKAKYVINVYSERYITIYPWDGNLTMDYIDMNGIYTNYNLYGLCKSIFQQN